MKTEVFKLYEDRDDVTLTAYVLHNSTEYQTDMKKPAVLICPGGGYLNCSDREADPVALAFASMGYHAFILRYSVYAQGTDTGDIFAVLGTGQTAKLKAKPEVAHPAPVREIGMSMALIKEHADEWCLDPDKVAICGFSAGAHNCAMYSVYWDKSVVVDYIGKDKELLRPAACILGYPLTDYVFMKETSYKMNDMDREFFDVANLAFLGTWDPSDELLDEVSPALHVDDQTPPTFIWGTSEDSLVPVQHSIHYAAALADHGIPYELHTFERGAHGLSTADQTSAMAQSELNPHVAHWVKLCGEWLAYRFAYVLPEKSPFEMMIAEGVSF